MKKYFPTPGLLPAIAGILLSAAALHAADAPPADLTPAPAAAAPATEDAPAFSSPAYLSPEESSKLVQLPPGYHLELVLSEPVIREPVVSAFDGNGRLYVAEMRSYMQDGDATDEKTRTSRVSLHWSSKGDGNLDRHSVFVDNLLLPRMILPLKDSVLIQETDTGDVFEYRDTNGDGVADDKKLFFSFEARAGANLEHQPSGLIWALDNWIYSTVNAVRIRWTPRGVVKEPTASNGGQWGIAQDNYGKTWVTNAGSDTAPLNFQQPIVYGAFKLRDEISPDFKEVFPLVGLADVQAGATHFRPLEKTLNRTTSAAGIEIFRGDRLPADLAGDLLWGEPVGRLVRRAKIEVRDGVTRLRNAYEKSEFLRSSDPYFRPVNLVTAPDGTIYITDMYRGIIQEGNWTRKGSYLRRVIDQYGMADKINYGRVWRLVHDSMRPGPQPQMLDETPAQLVAHLSHPNGWWRDTAQKLLILAQDKSVVPALQSLTRSSPDPLARIHALWTLEGLDSLDAALVREKLTDSDSHVRVAAIRASETLFKQGDNSLKPDIVAQCKDADPNIAIQGMLTANLLKWPEAPTITSKTPLSTPATGVKEIASQLLNPLSGRIGTQFTGAQRAQLERGQQIFLELCFACHGLDGKGTLVDGKSITLAPPLAGSSTATQHRDAIINVLLHGLSGPTGGRSYDAQMIPMGGNDDAWIAAVASYVRNSFGNQAPLVSVEEVAKVRAASAERKGTWTIAELQQSVPQPLGNQAAWKFTSNRAGKSDDGTPKTGEVALSFSVENAQTPGAWLQIELPAATQLTELRFNSTKSPRNFPRAYKVDLSLDGQTWGEPVATGRGSGSVVATSFPPTEVKYIRITQTQAAGGGRRGGGPAAPPAPTVPAGVPPVATGAVADTPGATAAAPAGAGSPPGGFGGFGGAPVPWTVDEVVLYSIPEAPAGPTSTSPL